MDKYTILQIIKVFLVTLLLTICFIWVNQLYKMFSDESLFDLKFTNVATALFFALANVCFSWARSLDLSRHELSIRKLNRVAFGSIFTSLFFVFSSFSNYILSTGKEQQGNDIHINPIFWLVLCAKYATTIIAFFLVSCVIWQIFKEALHLINYEYALISDDENGTDSRDERIPKRLRPYDKKERLLECIRKNAYHERPLNNNSIEFKKGDIKIIFQDRLLLKYMYVTISYKDGKGIINLKINTSNIHSLNNSIAALMKENLSEVPNISPLLHTEKL